MNVLWITWKGFNTLSPNTVYMEISPVKNLLEFH